MHACYVDTNIKSAKTELDFWFDFCAQTISWKNYARATLGKSSIKINKRPDEGDSRMPKKTADKTFQIQNLSFSVPVLCNRLK